MFKNTNDDNRQAWISKTLHALPSGARLLDAGAAELKNKKHCGYLQYVSQDFNQHHGSSGRGGSNEGLSPAVWDVSKIDIVSDITSIPEPDVSFDAILCSEVLEHVPEPTHALDKFSRLLKPGGALILAAPFSSNARFAPYHFCTGFSKYWYEHHLPARCFVFRQLSIHGDWYALLRQEITRLGGMERSKANCAWSLAYLYALLGIGYFAVRWKGTAPSRLS